jgi:hypothetical protein
LAPALAGEDDVRALLEHGLDLAPLDIQALLGVAVEAGGVLLCDNGGG